MSSCLEFEGKAVDNAVQKASEELNIPTDKLKYKVVSHGSSGIFGLVGVKKAKICVFLPEESGTEKRDRDRSPRKNNRKGGQPVKSAAALVQEAFHDTRKSSAEKTEPPSEAKPSEAKPSEAKPSEVKSSEAKPSEAKPSEAKPSEVKSSEAKPSEAKPSEAKPSEAKPSEVKTDYLSHESVRLGQEALQRVIDFITTGAKIDVSDGEDRVMFNVQGGDTGVLIGKRGQTLEAIQYLIEKIINKHSEERIRIQVDVEGYLENRRNNLRSLARRLADKTKHTGKPSTLGQMNAHDRRIVHLTLKDDTDVRTQSMGDGFYRKLVIFPKRKNFRRKKMY
ncbi:MAG: RNA-binding cell elongation regulator Jag/EloR [Desulfococcaceae bacterium]|jgi:spoIIIJ-associated protein|nr:RNA-binding cell elongation regulator Jag/EloR [Desulfococcaceae bacterium]